MLYLLKLRAFRLFTACLLLSALTFTQVSCGGINIAGIADAVLQAAPAVLTFNGKGLLSTEEYTRLKADFDLFIEDGKVLKNASGKAERIAAVKQLLVDFKEKAADFHLQNAVASKFFSEFYSKANAVLLGLSIYFNITGGSARMSGGARTSVPQTKEEINAKIDELKVFTETAAP